MPYSMNFNSTDLSSSFLVIDVKMPLAPAQRINTKQVPYRDGVIVQGSFFEALNFSVVGIVEGIAAGQVTAQQDAIAKLDALNTLFFADEQPKFLQFDNYMPTKAWKCRVNGEINIEWINNAVAQVTIPFLAPDPFPYAASATTLTNRTFPLTITDTNTSNQNAKPVLTLKGASTGMSITNGTTNESLSFANTYSGWIRIDTERMVVETSSNSGSTWTPSLTGVSGIFPTIKSNASNSISVSGFTGTVDVSFRARA